MKLRTISLLIFSAMLFCSVGFAETTSSEDKEYIIYKNPTPNSSELEELAKEAKNASNASEEEKKDEKDEAKNTKEDNSENNNSSESKTNSDADLSNSDSSKDNNSKEESSSNAFSKENINVTEKTEEKTETTVKTEILDKVTAEAAGIASITEGFPKDGTVAVDGSSGVRLRSWPWGDVINTYSNGTELKVIGVSGEFYLVDINGKQGYMHKNYVSTADAPASKKAPYYPGNTQSGGSLSLDEGIKASKDGAEGKVPNDDGSKVTTGGNESNNNENNTRKGNKSSYKTMYILGDSRCVGMKFSDTKKNHVYVAKSAMGYNYFAQTYQEVLNKATADDVIVINYGVNDLWNSAKYIPLINKIADSTRAGVYYMTVNPVDEVKEKANGYAVKSSNIVKFNQEMVKGLNGNVYIIDSYNLLVSGGFSTSDGVHYTSATYKEILNIIENNL